MRHRRRSIVFFVVSGDVVVRQRSESEPEFDEFGNYTVLVDQDDDGVDYRSGFLGVQKRPTTHMPS